MRAVGFGTLEYEVAQSISAPHAFTTRLGGVSTGHLASLNLGTGRGDTPQNVVENYAILGRVLGFQPEDVVMAHQTHSCTVRRVDASDRGAGLLGEKLPPCDALITDAPGVTLFVSTADCTPILLYDPVSGAVGAVHAGWRGTAADIAGKTVTAMAECFGCKPGDLRAAIGPNIGFCHFQTDEDVPQAMLETFGPAAQSSIRREDEKYYVNLKEINALALRRAGVQHIEVSAACTVCQSHRFWSHRVTQGLRGAQGALIQCKEGRL